MTTRISVALASYNGADFIEEQLESIASQVQLPDELVVCDDDSSDETAATVIKFSQKAPFVVRFERNTRRLGLTSNFEKALSLCTGDLIFLCDQDDVWFPEKLRVMTGIFRDKTETAVAVNDALLTNHDLSVRQGSLMHNMLQMRGSHRELTWGCCTVITRGFRNLCMPFPCSIEAIGFDHDTWLHFVGDLIDARLVVNQTLQFYRRHENNTSTSVAYRHEVSQTERLRYYQRLLWGYLSDGDSHAASLTIRMELIEIVLDRLEELRRQDEFMHFASKIAHVRKGKEALEKRISFSRLPRAKRVTAATSFFLAGGYGNSRGVKSFILDLLK